MKKEKSIWDYIIQYTPISVFLIWYAIDLYAKTMSEKQYFFFYFKQIEWLKVGLIPSIFFMAVAFRSKLCYYNKVSIGGIMLMNISTILFIGYGTELSYEWYDIIINTILISLIALLALILLIKKI
jgi:cell division protein FtsW (lipid II flippase)